MAATDALGTPSVIPPPPDGSNLPVDSRSPQAPLAPTPPPQAPPADQHSTLVGKVFKHVTNAMEGKRSVYVPDRTPDGNLTGGVREVAVPRRPGGVFRDILGGMLTGMAAAGSAQNPHPSGAAGLGIGFTAAQNAKQVVDSRNKVRAQEQATAQKNTQDQEQAQKSSDDLAKMSVASQTVNLLNMGHHIGLHADDEIDSHNNSSEIIKKEALNAGGAVAQIDHNDEPGNGPTLMEAFNKDPQSVMQGPDGFHRVPFITYDTENLKHDKGKWVNSDGSPLDDDEWNKRAKVTLVDLPNAAWGKRVTVTRKSANDIAGREVAKGEPGGSVSTDFGSLFGLGLSSLDQMNKARTALNAPIKNDAQYRGEKAKLDALKAQDPKSLSDEDTRWMEVRGPLIDKYVAKQSPVTATQVKQETEQFNKELREKGPDMDKGHRATLVERQKEVASKGVPDDIVAAIGPKPVPAQFPFGEDDPRYLAAAKRWGDASLNKKQALQAASGLARYQMMGDIRDYNVTNTTDQPYIAGKNADGSDNIIQPGEMGRLTANQIKKAPAGVILNTQDGTKILSKQAAIRDIQRNIDLTTNALNKIDKLDRPTRLKLAVALRSPDPESALKNVFTGEAINSLSPEAQDLVIRLQEMAENVMVARTVQGIGGSGSDMMRRALVDLVPTETIPSKEFAIKKMNAFQQTFNQLKTGVPTVGGRTNEPVGGGKFDASKLTNLHTNGKITVGWDGTQWVDSKTGTPYAGK